MILKRFHLSNIKAIGELISELAGMQDRFPVWLYIGDDRPNRSTNQNRYLFGVVYKVISQETGYTINEAHEFCKEKFGIKKIIQHEKIKQRGVGFYMEINISTTDYDTKEMTDYIEAIRVFFAENGIHIPDANEIPDELMIEIKKH